MSRLGTSDAIVVKPTPNIYTVLTGVALLVSLLAALIVFRQASSLFGGLFSDTTTSQSR